MRKPTTLDKAISRFEAAVKQRQLREWTPGNRDTLGTTEEYRLARQNLKRQFSELRSHSYWSGFYAGERRAKSNGPYRSPPMATVQIWQELGVDNQTDAILKIRELMK